MTMAAGWAEQQVLVLNDEEIQNFVFVQYYSLSDVVQSKSIITFKYFHFQYTS